MKDLVVELALELREQVLPHLGSHAGRARFQAGTGGDITFAVDRQAEEFLERFLAERAPAVSFYSEDRGLVEARGRADRAPFILIVDPIDGTRPAMAGLESCCVSVAAASFDDGEQPTMGDVRAGCVVEIKTGATFIAERGAGVELRDPAGSPQQPVLSANDDLSHLFWSSGFRGRPVALVTRVLEELIDTSSVGGAFFDLGSATFDMTRILTGQLDAYADVGSRLIERFPEHREQFERVGDGAVLNNSPYDLAAAVLCLEEGGAAVTDACGRPLDDRPLLGAGHEFQMSCLAAANNRLHSKMLAAINRGMDRLARHS